jgi:hypothetical protein
MGIMSSILFLNCMKTDSTWHALHFSMTGERAPDRKNGTDHKTQLHEWQTTPHPARWDIPRR